MTIRKFKAKNKSATSVASGRGFARWAGISKEDRSAEMSSVAKVKYKKYIEYKKIAEQSKLDTQA